MPACLGLGGSVCGGESGEGPGSGMAGCAGGCLTPAEGRSCSASGEEVMPLTSGTGSTGRMSMGCVAAGPMPGPAAAACGWVGERRAACDCCREVLGS